MQIKYYTYGNIIRILALDDADFSNSKMIDVNTDDETVLSIFDASRPFDAAFIRSYLNILSESTVVFKPTEDIDICQRALKIAKERCTENLL